MPEKKNKIIQFFERLGLKSRSDRDRHGDAQINDTKTADSITTTLLDLNQATDKVRSQINITGEISEADTSFLLGKIDDIPKLKPFRDLFRFPSQRGMIELFDVLPLDELNNAEVIIVNNLQYIINPKPLSTGGMGKVFKAFDPRLERAVAIKVLKKDLAVREEYRDIFSREAKVHANEHHENIVDVYQYTADTGPDGSTFDELKNVSVIVMQYINQAEGRMLNKIGLPDPDKFILITEQICKALEYLSNPTKRRNYVSGREGNFSLFHADLKPGNILITNDNVIKITDFGIANHAIGNVGAGTTSYLSPERLRGAEVDIRSELFSLTTILYELVTNVKFFNQNIPKDTAITFLDAKNIVENDLINREFEQMGPELEEYCVTHNLDKDKVNEFFKKAWQKNPVDRFQSPEDYFQALKEAFTP
jgi:serine/threonine protein kinase